MGKLFGYNSKKGWSVNLAELLSPNPDCPAKKGQRKVGNNGCHSQTWLGQNQFVGYDFSNQVLYQHPAHKIRVKALAYSNGCGYIGLIKQVTKQYRYYLTGFGRRAAVLALTLRELVVISDLAKSMFG